MSVYCISFLLFSLFTAVFIPNVNGLHREDIVGGKPVPVNKVRYQASLNVKDKSNHESTSICGATIVHAKFLLSIAQCVVDKDGIFIKQWYEALVGTKNITENGGLIIQIIKLYLSGQFNASANTDNILVIELEHKVANSDTIRILPISSYDFTVEHNGGIAYFAGYGYTWLDSEYHRNGTWTYNGDTDGRLKYLEVKIINTYRCRGIIPHLASSQMCGRTQARTGAQWGPCYRDIGGALVFDDHALAILSSFPDDCVDTTNPSIYSKVPTAAPFIKNIFKGTPPSDTLIFEDPTNSNAASASY